MRCGFSQEEGKWVRKLQCVKTRTSCCMSLHKGWKFINLSEMSSFFYFQMVPKNSILVDDVSYSISHKYYTNVEALNLKKLFHYHTNFLVHFMLQFRFRH